MIDQDNQHMKFSALNVDFSNLSFRFKEACALGCQRAVPLSKVVIYPLLACLTWKWLQIGTNMLL